MKLFFRIPVLFLLIEIGFTAKTFAQTEDAVEQLKQKLRQLEEQSNYLKDTAYANTILDLAYLYSSSYPDSALQILKGNAERCHASGYGLGEVDTYMITGDAFQTKGVYENALENYESAFQLAKKINYRRGISLILNRIGIIHLNQGNYPEALSRFFESLKAAEAIGNDDLTGATLNNIAVAQYNQGKFSDAENTYKQRLEIAQKIADTSSMSIAYNGIGEAILHQQQPLQALQNLTIAYDLAAKVNDQEMLLTTMLSLAEAYTITDSLQKAANLYENALQLSKQKDNGAYVCESLIGLAKIQLKQGALKEALAHALEALQKAEAMGQVQLMRDGNKLVAEIYEAMHDATKALTHYRSYKQYSDSLNNMASQRAIAIEKAGYEFSKKETEFERKTLQQQWIIASAFIGLLLLSVILWVIMRSKNRLNKSNKALLEKNIIIETQKLHAEETLSILKATQSQLIQSEKMASLGELTAGIAHEIQNPLNFVNNFSEVNAELIEELKAALLGSNTEEVMAIANDIKANEEKINEHGKRADAIVKGMLQHSRSGSSVKEPTNVNALADEYLRLSYHGIRAKDKGFNASLQTDFEDTIGAVRIIPQDIGRVLLNLYNNAFYAVNEKRKQLVGGYEPTVSVSTGKHGDKVFITVKDNGNGIPQKVVDKIFQPFFTTKPTGQGTGLGLSLSYDIIKAHGGEIKVESKEGEGAIFTIYLPVS